MSEAKREVWVVESEGGHIVRSCLIWSAAVKDAVAAAGERVVRYIPAESVQPAERAGEWVSVEERLPEHAQSVLFWGKGWVKGAVFGLGRFMTDEDGRRLFEDETQQEDDGPRMYPTDEVTHWMPLPPPPQPKGET